MDRVVGLVEVDEKDVDSLWGLLPPRHVNELAEGKDVKVDALAVEATNVFSSDK